MQTEPNHLTEATDVSENNPTHEEIATLAYALWEGRGCPEGSPEVDWFEAEQELKIGLPQR
jgi:Protein of unknown function (DUF2934)